MIGSAERPLVIGTRASKLALTQTKQVAADLEQRGLKVEIKTFTTEGDTNRASLSSLGGSGVFAAALRVALLESRCDLIVHSLKDLPTLPVPGLTIAAIPPREDPADVLVARDGLTLADLPPGSRVGTGSPRRARQVALARPDLDLVDIRGNVPTRLGRVKGLGERATQMGLDQGKAKEDLDGVILARAGLRRLGVEAVATDTLSEVVLPAGGQGALALECVAETLERDEARILAQTLRIVDDEPSRLEVSAERALLRYLEAGCAAPLGVRAKLTWGNAHPETPAGRLDLTARVVGDAGQTVEVSGETTVLLGAARDQREFALAAAEQLGVDLAQEMLEQGAGEIVDLKASKSGAPGQAGETSANREQSPTSLAESATPASPLLNPNENKENNENPAAERVAKDLWGE